MPGFVTGTSSEYLGRRPLRRLLRERGVVFLLGPRASGKTAVGRRIAAEAGRPVVHLSDHDIQQAVVARTRTGAWATKLVEAPALLLDGPRFLRNRPAVVEFLRELIEQRRAAGRKTVICEVAEDGSIPRLLDGMEAGSSVTVGLRFPASRSGRMRFARRACDMLGLPRKAANGTDALEPWGYEAVLSELRRRRDALATGAVGGATASVHLVETEPAEAEPLRVPPRTGE